LETTVFGAEQIGASARKQGERFAGVVAELLSLLGRQGVESRDELDRRANAQASFPFEGKKFTYDDLLALPARPGVYGFKNSAGAWLYIGKANNLKRRLLRYFGDTDESPSKLDRLREQSHTLVTHQCGSELESLLYEYRLIRKHAPLLNSNVDVSERKGYFSPIGDCIVLLRGITAGRGVSVWFRENQKILIKTFPDNGETGSPLVDELKTFFFSPRLPAASTDFPEQEIAARWIRQHADSFTIVPVSRMASAEEIGDALRIAWREFLETNAEL
jgi:GIY-YIG catalytic domain